MYIVQLEKSRHGVELIIKKNTLDYQPGEIDSIATRLAGSVPNTDITSYVYAKKTLIFDYADFRAYSTALQSALQAEDLIDAYTKDIVIDQISMIAESDYDYEIRCRF